MFMKINMIFKRKCGLQTGWQSLEYTDSTAKYTIKRIRTKNYFTGEYNTIQVETESKRKIHVFW